MMRRLETLAKEDPPGRRLMQRLLQQGADPTLGRGAGWA
jgi:hypothetical protein